MITARFIPDAKHGRYVAKQTSTNSVLPNTAPILKVDESAYAISTHTLMTDVLKACQILCGVSEAPHGWGVYKSDDDTCMYRSNSLEDVEIWQSEHRLEYITYIAEVEDGE